jgi:GNAT superfamily N-acetyltransferase
MATDYIIYQDPPKEEFTSIKKRVEDHKIAQTGGEYNQPGIEINLVMRNEDGNVVGGVIVSTEFRVMHLEVLWVADAFRRMGYGAKLVLAAEQIAQAKGCRAAQTWTFAFQGPQFYPTIGYKELGVYDGYPNGLTEHVFGKQLSSEQNPPLFEESPNERGITLSSSVTDGDLKILHEGLMAHVDQNVSRSEDDFYSINLVAKDHLGELVGGLYAWTTLNNLIFEYIWVDEGHRGKGLGTQLMNRMESIAQERGCIASQAYSFSFQAPDFFEKMGYHILGFSEGFPPPVKQFYFIKKYNE